MYRSDQRDQKPKSIVEDGSYKEIHFITSSVAIYLNCEESAKFFIYIFIYIFFIQVFFLNPAEIPKPIFFFRKLLEQRSVSIFSLTDGKFYYRITHVPWYLNCRLSWPTGAWVSNLWIMNLWKLTFLHGTFFFFLKIGSCLKKIVQHVFQHIMFWSIYNGNDNERVNCCTILLIPFFFFLVFQYGEVFWLQFATHLFSSSSTNMVYYLSYITFLHCFPK